MYTELETVNYIIAQTGNLPIDDINDTLPESVAAKLRLNEAKVTCLKRGWWFNEDLGVKIETDVDDKIPFPANTMKVVRASPCFLLIRSGFAYDPYEQTDTFPELDSVTVDLTMMLDWDDIPSSAQDYIRLLAAAKHVLIELEDEKKHDRLMQEAGVAYAAMNKDDIQVKQRNVAYNPKFIQTRGRVRPRQISGVNPNYPGG